MLGAQELPLHPYRGARSPVRHIIPRRGQVYKTNISLQCPTESTYVVYLFRRGTPIIGDNVGDARST